jgi:predicted GNAT family acetyltransferase
MFYSAKKEDLPRLLIFLKRDPEINLFIIADLEFYGLDNEFIKVWYQDPISYNTVILKYHNHMVLYSVSNNYSIPDLIRIISETKVDFFSCSIRCFKYIESQISCDFDIRIQTYAKLNVLVKPKFELIETKIASPEDGRKIAESLFKIKEFNDFITITLDEKAIQNEKKIREGFAIHFVIKEDDVILANANTSAICSVSAMIGGVFTLPNARKKGLATSVVYSLCEYLLKQNITPLLFFENPLAATIYHRLGFEDFDSWVICRKKQ